MLGIMSTESLCFLSKEEVDHKNFRMLGLLSNIIEGIPMLALQIHFLYHHSWCEAAPAATSPRHATPRRHHRHRHLHPPRPPRPQSTAGGAPTDEPPPRPPPTPPAPCRAPSLRPSPHGHWAAASGTPW